MIHHQPLSNTEIKVLNKKSYKEEKTRTVHGTTR